MRDGAEASHTQTAPILEEAESLLQDQMAIQVKSEALRSLREHFILSPDENNALTLPSEPVDDAFFAALAKAQKIQKDCETLLGYEDQTLGLELTEATTNKVNLAFQRLYKWIQREFKTLNLENPQMSTSIRGALRILAERPSLFQNCLDFFAEARERILTDSFYVALTGETPSGETDPLAKPIEMTAHDPLRYVGDMLAWTHSTAVSEREALEVLFISEGDEIARGIKSGRENEPWRLVSEEDEAETAAEFDAPRALNELVDKNMSGVARFLRQRVEQVIQSNEETVLAYKLANLVGFYRVTFSGFLGSRCALVGSMAHVESEALSQFRSLMRDRMAAVQGEFQQTPYDLGAPGFLQDALGQLRAILSTHDTSFDTALDREADFEPILTESLDPFLGGCETVAKGVPSPCARSIFLINCKLAALGTLRPFEFTASKVRQLEQSVLEHAKVVVRSQFEFLQARSGLADVFETVSQLDATPVCAGKLKTLAPFEPTALGRASQVLDDFLPSALIDAMEQVKPLQDSALARRVTEEAADEFCARFEHVEELLLLAEQDPADEDNGECLRRIFPRTAGEIRVLLS
jgi:conserved oligomeric Golgi complex subunit 6